jgi:hypothetical protein
LVIVSTAPGGNGLGDVRVNLTRIVKQFLKGLVPLVSQKLVFDFELVLYFSQRCLLELGVVEVVVILNRDYD